VQLIKQCENGLKLLPSSSSISESNIQYATVLALTSQYKELRHKHSKIDLKVKGF